MEEKEGTGFTPKHSLQEQKLIKVVEKYGVLERVVNSLVVVGGGGFGCAILFFLVCVIYGS